MILALILIVIAFAIHLFCWHMFFQIRFHGYERVGLGLAILLSIIATGSLLYASVLLDFLGGGKILLLFGTFLAAGLVVLFREMKVEGYTSLLPKKKSDAIFYSVFFLVLLLILIFSLKAGCKL